MLNGGLDDTSGRMAALGQLASHLWVDQPFRGAPGEGRKGDDHDHECYSAYHKENPAEVGDLQIGRLGQD